MKSSLYRYVLEYKQLQTFHLTTLYIAALGGDNLSLLLRCRKKNETKINMGKNLISLISDSKANVF